MSHFMAVTVANPASLTTDVSEADASITVDDLMRHTRILSSDEFEGRAKIGKVIGDKVTRR